MAEIDGKAYGLIPWAHISLLDFIHHAIETNAPVTLTVTRRPDVATRRWYAVEWTGVDGVGHSACASSLQLMLTRAATAEMESIAREEAKWTDTATGRGCPLGRSAGEGGTDG